MTYENGLANTAFEEEKAPEKSPNDEGLYDDVYYGTMNATAAPSGEDRPAKIVRKPVRKALGALNQYENVVIHNLTESLKRKIRPRLFRKESAATTRKECDCIQEEYANVTAVNQKRQAPPPPGKEAKKIAAETTTCKACGGQTSRKVNEVVKDTDQSDGTRGGHVTDKGDSDGAENVNHATGDVNPVVVHVNQNLNDVGHVNHRPADSVRSSGGVETIDNYMYFGTNRNPQMSTEI